MIVDSTDSFRLLFAANPRPMWVFDTETLAFLEVNDAAIAHYGYSREEFLQMCITDIRPAEDVAKVAEVVSSQRPPLYPGGEWRHQVKDGRVIDVEVASHTLTFQGRPARLVIAQDIGERRAARLAQATQARQFALVADLGLTALSGAAIGQLMEEAVAQVAVELGVEYTKVLELEADGEALLLRAGVGWQAAYVPGEARVSAGLESQAGYTLKSSEPVVVDDLRSETRFNGPLLLTEHGVVSGISVIIAGSERPYGVFGAHTTRRRKFESHDIVFVQAIANVLATAIDRSRADQRMRASEERFRAVVQNALHMVTIIDAEGNILYDSPPVQRTLGYAPEERVGHSMLGYLHPEDIEHVLAVLGELSSEAGAQTAAQVRVRHRDGSWRTVEATGTNMLHNEALKGIVVNWHDVTDWVRTQGEIERLNAELEERVNERTAELKATNQELEAFVYSVSHDLRAPLRAMDGFARILLEESSELSGTAQRYLARIRYNAQQMDELIHDLLSFSRLSRQALKKTKVSVAEVVQQVLDELEEERRERQVEVVVHALPEAKADRSLLKVLYNNLFSNAFKYTRARQAARIEVGVMQPEAESNGAPVYYVRDNGVGFDMKYAHKVFGVFQRLHRAEEYEGTGVGLATVHRIVRRHGGRVWVEAEVDKGTTVYFTIEESQHNG